MPIAEIIAGIDAEIARLEQARSLLTGTASRRAPGSSAGKAPKKKRVFSVEAIARIAAGQRNRWAKAKKASK